MSSEAISQPLPQDTPANLPPNEPASTGLSIASFFDNDIAFLKAMKDSLTSKFVAERQYIQQLEVVIRNNRKAISSTGPPNEATNIWSAYVEDLNTVWTCFYTNMAKAEKLVAELQAITNIRENQKKMLETEYLAIIKFVQKETKRYVDLKRDLSRLFDTCIAGLNAMEKSKLKGKISEKEKSLLEHNLIRLHETHNACLLAALDVKQAQELANNVHLPAMRRFMEAAYQHYLNSIIYIYTRLAELQEANGACMVREAKNAQDRLTKLEPLVATKSMPQIWLNAVNDSDLSDLTLSSVYQKTDPRLQSLSADKFCFFTETKPALDESVTHLQNDITSQNLKQERLETSIAEKKERFQEYIKDEDRMISGTFARQCEIAKLETEFSGVDSVKSSFSKRIAAVESVKSKNESPELSSLMAQFVSLTTIPAAVEPEAESGSSNSNQSPPNSAEPNNNSSSENHNGTSSVSTEKKDKMAKSKVRGFFKTVKRNIVSKIRHETLQNMSDDETASTAESEPHRPRSGSYSQVPPPTNGNSSNGRDHRFGSDDGSIESNPAEETPFWWSQVRDLSYFHGILPRADIDRMFQKNGNKNGDYLIRESILEAAREKVLILSVFWDQPRHFRMASQSNPKTSWRLTGPRDFATISELICFHTESGEKVAEHLAVKLVRPINRSADFLQNDWISLGRILGQGAYGAVYVGTFYPPTASAPMEVAVKVLKPQLSTMSKDEKTAFINEARAMQNLDHPHVVKLIGVAATREPMMLVMELCLGDSLLVHLRKNEQNMPINEMYRFAFEAASGMEYLSKMKLIHRDLAARNCLINQEKLLKISDFGLSRSTRENPVSPQYMEEAIYQPHAPVKIPIRWTAPESFSCNVYTLATDVWSYGILLWEIFSCGQMPWPNCRNNDVARDAIQSGERHPRPDRMPASFYDTVMLKCLSLEPEQRLRFDQIRLVLERYTCLSARPQPAGGSNNVYVENSGTSTPPRPPVRARALKN